MLPLTVAQNLIPQNAVWYDAVQVVLLGLLIIAVGWLAKNAISHGNRLVRLETIIGNHYQHRFDQIADKLGIEYRDTDDE